MKRLNSEDLNLCQVQARVFVESLKLPESSAVFIRRFMYSNLADRMDSGTYFNEASTLSSMIDEVEEKYDRSYGKVKYSEDELYWIGYLYRYWAQADKKRSKNIYRIAGASEMRKLYYPLHTMDPERAIIEIMEINNMENSLDEEKRRLEIMRRLILENKKKVEK